MTGDQTDSRAVLDVSGLIRRYTDTGRPAVDGIGFQVRPGEILCLLGPSGCGKSTTLRCVAGLETPDDGVITIAGREVSNVASGAWIPPEDRAVGFVFQSLALWPHLTAFDNVAYPLRVRRVARAEIRERVMKWLSIVDCEHLSDRSPQQLSGGEQQRVALARALIHEPSLVLFDEPFSALDARLRLAMRQEILRIRDATGMTAVFVTHDQEEALTLGDRIAVMFDGRFAELDTPLRVYDHPTNLRSARFVGTINVFGGQVERVTDAEVDIATDHGPVKVRPLASSHFEAGAAVDIGVRPHQIELRRRGDQAPDGSALTIDGHLESVMFLGTQFHCSLRHSHGTLAVIAPAGWDRPAWLAEGAEVTATVSEGAVGIFASPDGNVIRHVGYADGTRQAGS